MAASASATSGASDWGAAAGAVAGDWGSGVGAEVCEKAGSEAKSRMKMAERSKRYLSYQSKLSAGGWTQNGERGNGGLRGGFGRKRYLV